MRDAENVTVRLADYQPPSYTIDEIALVFSLDADATLVAARSQVQRSGEAVVPLVLDGKRLVLQSISIDGEVLDTSAYSVDAEKLDDQRAAGELPPRNRNAHQPGGKHCA